MVSKQKGDSALGKAISYFLSENYEVCLPIGDKRDYDLVIEKSGLLSRVQVKYAGLYPGKSTCRAALRIMGGNQSYNYAKTYTDDAFDYLFVYTAKDECFLLPWKDVRVRNEISVEAPKYKVYKLLSRGDGVVKRT